MHLASHAHLIARLGRVWLSLTLILGLVPVQVIRTTDLTTVSRNPATLVNSAPLAPSVVAMTATKRDALLVDVDGDTKADPGDTLRYTVVIANSGDTDAAGAVFTDTIDNNTVLSGTVKSTPLARSDAYSAVGNVRISVPAGSGVLANDNDPDGGAITVVAFNATSASGGSVAVNANGSFTYNPPPGYGGTDSFTYTIQDVDGNQTSATVSITVSGMIWFINAAAAAGGDGRLTTPFNCLTGADCFSAVAADDPGDSIFVYENAAAYAGGITPLNNQKLIGQDSTSSLATLAGVTPPAYSDALPAMNLGAPATTINGGTNAVTLAQNNALYGFTGGNASGASISGSSFGTLIVNEVIVNTTGIGLSLNTGAFGSPAAFTSITSSGGANNVSLTSIAGTANLGGGSLSGASSHAFVVNGGTGTVTYGGTINNTTARSISVSNKTGGAVTFAGVVSGTAQGVVLSSNTGATINFTGGGMNLNTGANAAFTATGGGMVNVTGAGNVLNTTTGTALNVQNTTIGASSLNFQSISANGGANGIVLNNTGTSGGLIVTGSGGSCNATTPTCTGGVIQNTTGADDSSATPIGTGIVLNNTANVSLTRLRIRANSNYGIRGMSVSGFTLNTSLIDGTNGTNVTTPFNDGSLSFDNLGGTSSIANSEISGGFQRNIRIDNSSGTLNLTVTGNNIHDTGATQGDDGLFVEADTTANVTLNITNNTFRAHGGDHFNLSLVNSATANLTLTGNTLRGGHPIGLGQGIFILGANYNGSFTYNIASNNIQGNNQGGAIHVNKGSGTATFSGRIQNNVVGDPVIDGSGSLQGSGIDVEAHGTGGTHTTLVAGNQVYRFNNNGIVFIAGEGNPTFNMTVMTNTISTPNSGINPLHGMEFNIGTLPGETIQACIDARNNILTNGGAEANGGVDLRLRQRQNTTVRLPGYGGAAFDNAAVTAFETAQNTLTSILVSNSGSGGGFVGGAACAQPTLLLSAPKNTAPASSDQPVAQESALAIKVSQTWASDAASTAPRLVEAPQTDRSAQPDRVEAGLNTPLGPITPINIGMLPAGKTITLTFDVTINNPVLDGATQVSNQGTVSGGNFPSVLTDDPDTGAPNDPTITPLNLESDLQITKSVDQSVAVPGQMVKYTLTYRNNGPQPVGSVVITDQVPITLTTLSYQSSSPITPTGLFSYIWNVGNLPAGAGGAITITGIVSPGLLVSTVFTNTGTIGSSDVDTNPLNNTASIGVTVLEIKSRLYLPLVRRDS